MTSLLLTMLLAPLLATCLCLAGSRRLPARTLAFIGSGGMVLALIALAAVWTRGGGQTPPLVWAALGETRIQLQLEVDRLNLPLLAVLYAGGALLLLSIGLAFSPSTRGFGGLISALLIAFSGSSLALTSTDLLLFPLGWGLATLGGFSAARAAGVAEREGEGEIPGGPIVSLLAVLALLVALLLGNRPALLGDQPLGLALTSPVLILLLLAALAALGLPPLHGSISSAAAAPAGLAAASVGLGLPLLGGYTLLRISSALPALSDPWPLVLIVIGLLSLIVAGAATLGQRSPRQLLGWQVSAQGGALLAALGAGGQLGLAAALLLLLNMALLAVSGYLALALLERRSGRDAIEELPRLRVTLPLAGLALGVSACAALGLPPTPGFWGRLWLIEAFQGSFAWATPLLIAGTALGAPAWLGPLAAFWRRDTTQPEERQSRSDQLPPLVVAVGLLALGIAPQLAVLAAAPQPIADQVVTGAGLLPTKLGSTLLALLALGIIIGALRLRGLPVVTRLEEERTMLPMPQGLADSLFWLRLLAEPVALYRWLWQGLLLAGAGAQRVLALFEQRYYLAAVLLALISMLLLIVQ